MHEIIQTVDNFDSKICKDFSVIKPKEIRFAYSEESKYSFTKKKEDIDFSIKFYDYKKKINNCFSIIDKKSKKDNDLIISVSNYTKDNKNIFEAKTGNYIGKFVWGLPNSKKNVKIDIKSRFPDLFLKRMLNFANDVFLDDINLFDAKSNDKENIDYSKFIIYYMFIQKLEKAFLLGLPKTYKSINHHDMKIKGKIDINKFIRFDIPFKGKISSVSRELREIQEIIDSLYKAIDIIDKSDLIGKKISHIKTHLKQNKSNNNITKETIAKAMKSKALQNPIFSSYNKVLEYAKIIIEGGNLKEKKDEKDKTFGFLVNVAELFEIYIYKLIQNSFPDWEVSHEPKLESYSDLFYQRKMYPDIVMEKDNNILVFDAKYKKMLMRESGNNGGDIDRNDFFQINTYMSYYKNEGKKVLAGGLLYPIEGEFNKNEYHSNDWLGNNETKFIIDGIELFELNKIDNEKEETEKMVVLKEGERKVIERIKAIIETYNSKEQ